MGGTVVLVFDCGATNLRVAAVNEKGEIVAQSSTPNRAVQQPGGKPGWLIWDLDEIWGKLCGLCREVLKVVKPGDVKAVTVTTWGADGAPVKRDGTLTYPVISWQCTRTVETAEKFCTLVPCADMVRFASSGSEAVHAALRLARGITDRTKIVRFEGHYHGVNDTVGYSHWPDLDKAGPAHSPRPVPDSAGIPPGNSDLITLLPFNDADAFERCLRGQADSLAAVIMEPVNYDSCGLVPTPEFLHTVRELTRELGVVLIFDEVLSGFRVRAGGALGDACIPDMTVLGKAVGGGMPISAFIGRHAIMETCTPVGPALHSGTYNAPPMLVAAIGALLDEVARPGFYVHLDALGKRLYAGLREILARRGIKAWVQGVGSRFGLLFGLDEEPRNYRDVAKQDLEALRRFHLACLERGVYLHYISPHHGYSIAHTMADIEETLSVMDDAAKTLAR